MTPGRPEMSHPPHERAEPMRPHIAFLLIAAVGFGSLSTGLTIGRLLDRHAEASNPSLRVAEAVKAWLPDTVPAGHWYNVTVAIQRTGDGGAMVGTPKAFPR